MYEPVTAEIALNAYCGQMLTTIGLSSLYSEPASQINPMPAPSAAPGGRLSTAPGSWPVPNGWSRAAGGHSCHATWLDGAAAPLTG